VTVVLWHIEVSHYNEKARWALDYKGIPYELRAPMPGAHRLTALRLTRGKHDRLPVLGLEGRRIGDSTAIIAALEDHQPEPPLYPADPAERERALALEDHFDEELGPRVRRAFWHYTLDDPQAATDAAIPNAGAFQRGLMLRTAPITGRLVRRDYAVDQAGADEAAEGIRAAMDRVESELGSSGYLVGDGFTVADLTAAALFTPVLSPPERPYAPQLPPQLLELRSELEARRGGAWVTDIYARHRGTPVAVA
jgi:glutathione S-transferase